MSVSFGVVHKGYMYDIATRDVELATSDSTAPQKLSSASGPLEHVKAYEADEFPLRETPKIACLRCNEQVLAQHGVLSPERLVMIGSQVRR